MWPYLSMHKHPEASLDLLICLGIFVPQENKGSSADFACGLSTEWQNHRSAHAGGVIALVLSTPLKEGADPTLPQAQT